MQLAVVVLIPAPIEGRIKTVIKGVNVFQPSVERVDIALDDVPPDQARHILLDFQTPKPRASLLVPYAHPHSRPYSRPKQQLILSCTDRSTIDRLVRRGAFTKPAVLYKFGQAQAKLLNRYFSK